MPDLPTTETRNPRGKGEIIAALLVGAGILAALSQYDFGRSSGSSTLSAQQKQAIPVGNIKDSSGMPAPFAHWPAQKPEAVLAITGQMHAYLQKCGCSDPQKGGLERRYIFLKGLRDRGWNVLPLDLGGVNEEPDGKKPILREQALLKYVTTMQSMKLMDYKAVGIAKEEVSLPLIEGLTAFSLQNNPFPEVISKNVSIRDLPADLGLIKQSGVYDAGPVKVGVTSIVGRTLRDQMLKLDPKLQFARGGDENAELLAEQVADFAKAKVGLKVLLFNDSDDPAKQQANDPKNPFLSSFDMAKKVAAALPGKFDLIVCRSDESEPRRSAEVVGGTTLIQVGQKGQNVGVVGIFKTKTGYELKYEVVTMLPEYETPKGGKNPILDELEKYSTEVKAAGLLAKFPKQPHDVQLTLRGAAYAGSESCKACHIKEWEQYQKVGAEGKAHSVAYATLVNATRPSNRQFDAECIVCHTVGFEYQTGFSSAELQPQLKNVGCENCHGPGSVHNAEEAQIAAGKKVPRTALPFLSPWKIDGQGAMPDAAKIKRLTGGEDIGNVLTPLEYKVFMRVHEVCRKCHNDDADPHFVLEKYWPNVAHTFPKANGAGK